MPRVKGGSVTRQRRKKIIKLAKGYRGAKHIQFKVAKQQVMKSYQYAFRDRRRQSLTSVSYGLLVLMLLLVKMTLATAS